MASNTDTLPEDAWVNNFLASQPRPLLSSLQRRLQASTCHVTALAELYKQRSAIEAQYADSLQKLARAAESGALAGKGGNEWEKTGGEAKLWDVVVSELSETSSSHSTFSAMIKTDFEQPIRDLPKKSVAWRRIADQDSSLEKTLREYEKTSSKLEKASGKKSGKSETLSAELNQITQSLSSLSPMVYTTYQRLDEERLRGLKEVIVRWGTVRADIAGRDGERADRAVVNLVGWETGDEVLSVGRRLGGGSGGGSGRNGPSNAPTLNSVTGTPQSIRRMSSAASNTATDFSPRPTPRQNGSSSNAIPTAPPTSFAGGLKSMLGRKPTLARNRSGSNATSTRSGRDQGFNAIGEEDDRNRFTGRTETPPVDEEGFSVAPTDRHRAPWEDPNELVPIPAGAPAASTPKTSSGFTQGFTASPSTSEDNLPLSSTSQPKLNLALASAPIQEDEDERQAALARMQQTLQMQPPQQPSRRGTIARGRRDVRNTMFGGISDDGTGGSPLPRLSETGGQQETLITSQSEISSPPGSSFNFGAIANGVPSGVDRPQQLSRQTSVSSMTSNNPFDSPGLSQMTNASVQATSSEPGLRASLTETLNVSMRAGSIQRVQINGEIHVSLRFNSSSPSNGPIHIRLTSFEQLEKIAPNPAYLAQVPDRPGEYFLNSEVLAGATNKAGMKGTLLFKYQVHVAPGKEESIIPFILEPAFSCKSGETRMILNYRPTSSTSISPNSLSDISLTAQFAPGVNVSNVQAKPPGGVWSPSTRRMTWPVPSLTDAGKIIARFTTEEGEMVPQGVVATWSAEGMLSSGLGVEVVSAEGGLSGFEEVKKGIYAGRYLAEGVVN